MQGQTWRTLGHENGTEAKSENEDAQRAWMRGVPMQRAADVRLKICGDAWASAQNTERKS
jgi:hypothetical protein